MIDLCGVSLFFVEGGGDGGGVGEEGDWRGACIGFRLVPSGVALPGGTTE